MHLLHLLPGQRAYPASPPAENSGTKQSAEESRNGLTEATAHHANARENQATETDDSSGVHCEGSKSSHERSRAGEIHRSLCMGYSGIGEGKEPRQKHPSNVEEPLNDLVTTMR